MAVGITVAGVSASSYSATFTLTGLDTGAHYDVIRVIEGGDDNERKYQIIDTYRDWQPPADTVTIIDGAAPLRTYRVGVWDSSGVTPVDFDFSTGGYTGPAALATSGLVTLTAPACGILLRSTRDTSKYVEASVHDVSPVLYRARVSELTPMGTRYPVVIADRREGRRVERLVIYTRSVAEAKALMDVLVPENGRIYPVWIRTMDNDKLLLSDLLLMPGDITVEAASKHRPEAKFWTVEGVEIDPRKLPGGVV
jgi:hypothetical protein